MSDNEKATNSDEILQEPGIGLQHAELHDLPPDPDAHLSEAEKAEVVRLLQFLIPPGFSRLQRPPPVHLCPAGHIC